METQIKSCLSCKHLSQWNHSATQHEPADSGWECGHPKQAEFPDPGDIHPNPNCKSCHGAGYVDGDTGIGYGGDITNSGIEPCGCWDETDDDAYGEFYARNCPGYEFFDWDEQKRIQTQNEIESEINDFITDEQQAELNSIRKLHTTNQLIASGLLDTNGKPTNEYYRLSDQQYDAHRYR
jgi:hypothetical protein